MAQPQLTHPGHPLEPVTRASQQNSNTPGQPPPCTPTSPLRAPEDAQLLIIVIVTQSLIGSTPWDTGPDTVEQERHREDLEQYIHHPSIAGGSAGERSRSHGGFGHERARQSARVRPPPGRRCLDGRRDQDRLGRRHGPGPQGGRRGRPGFAQRARTPRRIPRPGGTPTAQVRSATPRSSPRSGAPPPRGRRCCRDTSTPILTTRRTSGPAQRTGPSRNSYAAGASG